MKIEVRDSADDCFTFVSGDGVISGYASLFDVVDYYGTATMPGAFLASIAKGEVKFLWQHKADKILGTILELREDAKGLFMRAQINLKTELGAEAKSLIETGAISGLSIGFNILESVMEAGVQKITKADLWEISLVTFQALEEATVDSMQLFDRLTVDGIRKTSDGYIAADARVARTGIQLYRGSELGRPDLDKVRVYRPEHEVFSKDSLRSYAHRPLTNDHPPVSVTADNWKQYAVGQTGDEVARDGEHVRIPLVLMDRAVISDFENGKRELSLGYTTDLKWVAGVTKSGEAYDAIQTSIRANHLAVVAAARGGPTLKLGDDNEGDNSMTTVLKSITVDSIPVEVSDVAASVIMRYIDQSTRSIESLRAKLAEEDAEKEKKKAKDAETVTAHDAAMKAKDAEIATLKQQLTDAAMTPAKLDTLVKDRATVIGKARAVIGDKLVVDGKSDLDIQRQVVNEKLGDAAKGWGDGEVAASFRTITAGVKAEDGHGTRGDALADALSRAAPHNAVDAREKAYTTYDSKLENAWKGPQPAARQ